ncbi:MAG TPA: hypothetical protein VIJ14_07920 [Rhabdochlamydiaceae bacterium]
MATSKQIAKFGTELTFDTATLTGSFVAFSSPLVENPALIIFDNQSNTTVVISDDGVTNSKTFVAGEALVIDNRSDASIAVELTWPVGTNFYASGTAGVGLFRISYVYAK